MKRSDEYYMEKALLLAQEAYSCKEVPIGALIVSGHGEILGTGYNQTEVEKCQDKHAEMSAIRAATKKLDNWRLEGTTLYVTLEPCLMCLGCIVLSRIERLVYGANSPQFGYHFGHENMCELYARKLKNITAGVCKKESEALLRKFFQGRRR